MKYGKGKARGQTTGIQTTNERVWVSYKTRCSVQEKGKEEYREQTNDVALLSWGSGVS